MARMAEAVEVTWAAMAIPVAAANPAVEMRAAATGTQEGPGDHPQNQEGPHRNLVEILHRGEGRGEHHHLRKGAEGDKNRTFVYLKL